MKQNIPHIKKKKKKHVYYVISLPLCKKKGTTLQNKMPDTYTATTVHVNLIKLLIKLQ